MICPSGCRTKDTQQDHLDRDTVKIRFPLAFGGFRTRSLQHSVARWPLDTGTVAEHFED